MTIKRPSIAIFASTLALSLSLLTVFVSQSFGQSVNGTFPLSGTVQSPDGRPIAKAVVDLYQSNIKIRSSFSKGDGTFVFNDLLPGQYQLKIEAYGFDLTAASVTVGPENPARINIKLSSISGRNANTGSHQISADTVANQNSISLSQQSLDKLPVFDQDYIGFMSRFLDPGSVGTTGTTTVVDGVESTDVGLSTSGIRELHVNRDPYSVIQSRPGFGRIEIETKSGTQEFHGNFNFTFRNSSLNGRDALSFQRQPDQRRIYEGIFTGPMGKGGKTSFLFSLDRDEDDPAIFVNPQQIDAFVTQPRRNLLVAGEIDHLITDRNSFSVRYSFNNTTIDNQGIGGEVLPEAGVNNRVRENRVQYNQHTSVSPKLTNEIDVVISETHVSDKAVNPGPTIEQFGSFVGGGAEIDQIQSRSRMGLNDVVSYVTGRHSLFAGISIPELSRNASTDHIDTRVTEVLLGGPGLPPGAGLQVIRADGNGRLVFSRQEFSGFIQDEFRFHPNFTISAGLRYDWQNFFKEHRGFGPRFSLAYGFGKDPKTVVRAGFGIFYDRIDNQTLQTALVHNGAGITETVETFSELLPPSFSPPFTSVLKVDPSLKTPYTIQYNVGIERQLGKKNSVSINYLGSRGVHLFSMESEEIFSPPPQGILNLTNIVSAAKANSDYLEASFRGHITRLFTGLVEYRYGVAHDNTEGINSATVLRPFFGLNQLVDYARSDFDRRHRFETAGQFDLLDQLNLGFSVSFNSGTPFNVPNINPTPLPTEPFFFRNAAVGPANANLDLRLSKDFKLRNSKKESSPILTFDIDAFNALNRTNITKTLTVFGPLFANGDSTAGPPRRLQLTARFRF